MLSGDGMLLLSVVLPPPPPGLINHHRRVPSEAFDIIAQRSSNNNNNDNTGIVHHHEQQFGDILSGTDDDDISTLGEPYLGPMMNSPQQNTTTATHNNNNIEDDGIGEQSVISAGQEMYVYGTRSRLNTKDDGTTTLGGGIRFGDDATLEIAYANNPYMKDNFNSNNGDGSAIKSYQHIVILAPSGALGIVIDNVTGDLPILHAIRETSVLHRRVFVGDFLLSVDEVDCRGMSAIQVSKLISGRSENSSRKLTLLRPSSDVGNI